MPAKSKSKTSNFTYIDMENKSLDSLATVLKQFEMALRGPGVDLPLEWLTASLEAGAPLPSDDYLPEEPAAPAPQEQEAEEK